MGRSRARGGAMTGSSPAVRLNGSTRRTAARSLVCRPSRSIRAAPVRTRRAWPGLQRCLWRAPRTRCLNCAGCWSRPPPTLRCSTPTRTQRTSRCSGPGCAPSPFRRSTTWLPRRGSCPARRRRRCRLAASGGSPRSPAGTCSPRRGPGGCRSRLRETSSPTLWRQHSGGACPRHGGRRPPPPGHARRHASRRRNAAAQSQHERQVGRTPAAVAPPSTQRRPGVIMAGRDNPGASRGMPALASLESLRAHSKSPGGPRSQRGSHRRHRSGGWLLRRSYAVAVTKRHPHPGGHRHLNERTCDRLRQRR